jgi:hypothetical protein
MTTIDQTEARLNTHEEVCALRYESICARLKRLEGMGMTVAGLRGPGPRGGRVLAMVAVRLGEGGRAGSEGDGPGEGGDGGQGLHGLSLGGGAICPLLFTGRHTGRDWMRPVKTSPSRPAKVFA